MNNESPAASLPTIQRPPVASDKASTCRDFLVDFDGKSAGDYARPVRVNGAIDDADAWAAVVAHHQLDPTRFRPIVTAIK